MTATAETAMRQLANHGNNLLGTTVLALGGAVFGFIVFQEHDLSPPGRRSLERSAFRQRLVATR
jgi:hypothetical protein